ncbi:response regulator [Aminomonas paucivorans]|uniref:response regulator n=1 Tax=Aminomonas paucivorans TaxID=81412 RepID=UPI00332CF841
MDPSNLKVLLAALGRAESRDALAETLLKAVCEILKSPKAFWWCRKEEFCQVWSYSGTLRRMEDRSPEERDATLRALESFEPVGGAPALREGHFVFPSGVEVDRLIVAPYDRLGSPGWIVAAGRETPYAAEDLMVLWTLAEGAALALEAFRGRQRNQLAQKWGHYLRTPLWTLTLALEDLEKQHSRESYALALGASRVLASQVDTFLCEVELEGERFGTPLPLPEALGTLRGLGAAWQRMEGREFELLLESLNPQTRIRYGGLQLLLALLNRAYVDREAQGVFLALRGEEGALHVFGEAWGMKAGSDGALDGVLASLAARYVQVCKTLPSVRGEALEVRIPLLPGGATVVRSLGTVPKVLVVDDSLVNRKALAGMLEQMGVQAITACDGLEALDRVAQDPPDLVFMDLLMPRMTGIQATLALRERGFEAPILALTAGGESDLAGALEAGMDETLFKPISGKLLRDVLAQWTGYVPREGNELGDKVRRLARDAFLEELSDLAGRLKTALDERDGEQVRKLAHRLKGDSAQGGFGDFSRWIQSLEDVLGTGGDLTPFRSHLDSPDLLNLPKTS